MCGVGYLGVVASVTVIAGTVIGMLTGRIDWRTGVRVVLGIFILFGAPIIARELMALGRNGDAVESGQLASGGIPQPPVVPKNAPVADPYAGAGMPQTI